MAQQPALITARIKPFSGNKIIAICGPTASGKSSFAHTLAQNHNGEIVNCDAMQIYQQIPIITASPTEEHKKQLPYHLYNFLEVTEEFSVVKYAGHAAAKINEILIKGKLPIVVGGTGMYLNALLFGYNRIPEIENEIRLYVRDLQIKLGQEAFFEELLQLDPMAIKLNKGDRQRTARAFEVARQTGKSIFSFQASENIMPLHKYDAAKNLDIEIIFLHPERSFLYDTCNKRLVDLFKNGAIEEVEALAKNNLREGNLNSLPAAKALGVHELLQYTAGEITLGKALTLAQARTRQYAKRQITWFTHQLTKKTSITYASLNEFEAIIKNYQIT